jgi:hypothetical protein
MSPDPTVHDQRDGALADAERVGDHVALHALGVQFTDAKGIGLGQSRETMGRALLRLLTENAVRVFVVLGRRHVFEVGQASVALVAVLVVALMTGWPWSEKGRSYENMHEMFPHEVVIVQIDSRVVDGAFPVERFQDAASSTAAPVTSDLSFIADVVESFVADDRSLLHG